MPKEEDSLKELAERGEEESERAITHAAGTVAGDEGRIDSTCWTWFWSSICMRAAERAGLARRGTAGAAPRRPAY